MMILLLMFFTLIRGRVSCAKLFAIIDTIKKHVRLSVLNIIFLLTGYFFCFSKDKGNQ